MTTPVCRCSVPQLYPVRCECLDLDILSEQMHAIARAEPLIVNGQPRDYDREVMIAAWRRSQSPQPVAEPCCDKPRRSIVSAARGAIGLAKATAGINAADRDTIEQRYATCQACPHNDCGQCQRCGCWIAPKIRIRSENCPLGTW